MKVKQSSTIVAVTGTKGKTSVVRAVHFAMQSVCAEPVLRVDTNSVVLGSEKKFGLYDSWKNAGFVPTVCPGRFLILLHGQREQCAILEAAVGSARVGLGYRSHTVGVFTNVYDDHVGVKEYLGTREDLADAKASFIFAKIRHGGTAVYNADEPLITERLNSIPEDRKVQRVACTLANEPVSNEDVSLHATKDSIVLYVHDKKKKTLLFRDYPWVLDGKHTPTVYNFMFVVGALWGLYGDSDLLDEALETLKRYVVDPDGGRMVSYMTADGVRVIVDFAHEKVSMRHVAEYARSLSGEGRVLGVLRLDNSRPDVHVKETGAYLAQYYDNCFVYDKEVSNGSASSGRVAELFAESISAAGTPAGLYTTDTEALRAAKELAGYGDTVVYIISSYDEGRKRVQKIFEKKEMI